MQVSVKAREAAPASADLVALPLSADEATAQRVPSRVAGLDRDLDGVVARALSSGDFRGRKGETLILYPADAKRAARVLLVGLGPAAPDADALRRVAGSSIGAASARRATSVEILVPPARGLAAERAAQALAEGAVLSSYRCDHHREKPDDAPIPPERMTLRFTRLTNARAVRAAAALGVLVAGCQNTARRLSDEPANALPPAELAREAQKTAKEVGLRCEVMGVTELRQHKMGALLAVGQGSSNPPRLIVLEHRPAPRGRGKGRRKAQKAPTLCIVGKGITFDSGGISIKPAAGMQDMKHDMGGAAAVVGALRAAALMKLPLHVVGVIASAENMPSGTAYRPGDVVRAMSGKTIEIVHTDAEGRVVLADALHYARTNYEPEAMVDLATLTGACMIALGPWATGVFGSDRALVDAVHRAGERAGERAWPMPLLPEHREAMRSQIADLRNAGGREGGASTAAGFLWSFVADTPWVHLDIAGTGWTDKPGPYQPRGATGVGVRLLVEWMRSRV